MVHFLRLTLLCAGCVGVLSACGGGSTSTPPAAAVPAGGPQAPQFVPSSVHIASLTTPADTEILSVDSGGAVYFGSTDTIIPGFCLYVAANESQCSGSDAALYRYSGGTFTATAPRGPYFGRSNGFVTCNGVPVPADPCSFGNVSAIDATDYPSVIWASDYAPDSAFIPFSRLQWGGSGGTAATPPAMYNHDFQSTTGDEIVSIVHATNGQIWLGGGGPHPDVYPASVPATCQSTTCDLLFLVNGPNGNVWGVTRTYAKGSLVPNGSAFFEFDPSGSLIKTYNISDVAVRIAATKHDVWFTDYSHNAVGKIDPNGTVTEYTVPTASAGPYGITATTDDSVWFTEYNARKVGRIDSTGHIDEFAVTFQPFSIAAPPPGCASTAIWVGSLGPSLAEITFGP